MYIQASEIKNEFHTDTEGDKLLKLIEEMQWDRDNFSSSGKQTFDQIGELLGWGHQNDWETIPASKGRTYWQVV